MSNKFRKRPVVIEAFQMNESRKDRDSDWPEWLLSAWEEGPLVQKIDGRFEIETLEGVMQVEWGDWIIRGVKGELYPCKPDIFLASYEELR